MMLALVAFLAHDASWLPWLSLAVGLALLTEEQMKALWGVDLSCTDDLEEGLREVWGLELLAQAAYRRLTTRRIEEEDYGIDVRDWLSEGVTTDLLALIPGMVSAELGKDPRFGTVTTVPKFDKAQALLTLDITIRTAAGPLDLALTIDKVTVKMILGGA
jgi:hypothetical protein